MDIGKNIRELRKSRGVTQQQIADLINMHRSNYSKVESGQREISISAVNKIAKYFSISVDDLINSKDDIPQEISIKNKTSLEKIKLIEELEEEEQNMVFKFIDSLLTKKKFKDFFQQNIVTAS
jgi:transcriptional regulator with XRE-family HTH domain